MTPRILIYAHGHPSLSPAGGEIAAHSMFKALEAQYDAYLLAANTTTLGNSGTHFQSVKGTERESLFWAGNYNYLTHTSNHTNHYLRELKTYLLTIRPDIIHMHHYIGLGIEALHVMRQTLPDAKIILTLHEYHAICARYGIMYTESGELCHKATPKACNQCFSFISPERFFVRERLIKTHFEYIDAFISPSAFLANRYVEWGLPQEKLHVIPNGLPETKIIPASSHSERNRFGFFGQINTYKGADILLEAAHLLKEEQQPFSLTIHGTIAKPLKDFRKSFMQQVKQNPHVKHKGAYKRASLPRLMRDIDWVVVPSVWWENAPLVIDEALQQKRPVIVSDIGGMAEKIQDGKNGLHFKAGNAASLVAALKKASNPVLWNALQQNITPPVTMHASLERHIALYQTLSPIFKTQGRKQA